jgi:hypothetical protein
MAHNNPRWRSVVMDDEMPADVYAAAFGVVSDIQMKDVTKWESWDALSSILFVADAILRERNRCAKIAETEPEISIGSPAWKDGAQQQRRAIAAAIRKGDAG